METEERIDYRKANNETLYAMRQMVDSYIRLTNLVPPLLDMVDEGKIALMRGDAIDSLENTQIQSQIFFERGSSAICLVAT